MTKHNATLGAIFDFRKGRIICWFVACLFVFVKGKGKMIIYTHTYIYIYIYIYIERERERNYIYISNICVYIYIYIYKDAFFLKSMRKKKEREGKKNEHVYILVFLARYFTLFTLPIKCSESFFRSFEKWKNKKYKFLSKNFIHFKLFC